MLSEKKGLSKDNHKTIWEMKQNLTLEKLRALEPNAGLIQCMNNLVSEGYKIAVCSNSIRKTVLCAFKVRYYGVYGFGNI